MSAPKTLDDKLAEKQRLAKAYKVQERQKWAQLCEQEPRIVPLRKAIRRIECPETLLLKLADSWVRFAPLEVRYAALRLIDRQANKIKVRNGGRELDDPLPPARNLYFAARDMLAVR